MSDLKLFCIDGGKVKELTGKSMALEKHLQHVIEQNTEILFRVRRGAP